MEASVGFALYLTIGGAKVLADEPAVTGGVVEVKVGEPNLSFDAVYHGGYYEILITVVVHVCHLYNGIMQAVFRLVRLYDEVKDAFVVATHVVQYHIV